MTSLAWGLFFVLIGVAYWFAINYSTDVVPYVALGIGAILIGLCLARAGLGMSLNKFSLFIGIAALAFGGAALTGYRLSQMEMIIVLVVLIGLFIVAEAAHSLMKPRRTESGKV